MGSFRVTLTVVLAAGAFAGCASSSAAGGGLPTCGSAPVTSGPASALASITLTAPGEARRGSVIRPTVTVRVAGADEPKDLGLPAELDIVRAGKVVGTYHGAIAGVGLWLRPEAHSAQGQQLPAEPLLLSGCPAAKVDFADPDATRRPLPAGEYQLIASVEGTPFGEPTTRFASAPVAIRLT